MPPKLRCRPSSPLRRVRRSCSTLAILLAAQRDAVAELNCSEAGKPITAAHYEVERGITTLRLAGNEARRLPTETDQLFGTPAPMAFTTAQRLGVVAAVTPFNFLLNLVVHKVGPGTESGDE